MKGRKRTLWLAVAAAMLVPAKSKARERHASAPAPRDDTPQRQGRRRQAERPPQVLRPIASPCGGHVAEVIGGAVFIDGRRVPKREGHAYVVAAPTWRRDGRAVAWLERGGGEARLLVALVDGETIPWTLPAVSTDDRVFWAGPRRVVVGPALLAPRAVATWPE